MNVRPSRKRLTVMIILLLLIAGAIAYLIQEGFWANINSQGMIRLAKEDWNNGKYFNSIHWNRAAYSSALVSGLRWEIFRIYSYRIGKLREQGKLSEAFDVCLQATTIWNQEGATSFMCITIEDEISKQK